MSNPLHVPDSDVVVDGQAQDAACERFRFLDGGADDGWNGRHLVQRWVEVPAGADARCPQRFFHGEELVFAVKYHGHVGAVPTLGKLFSEKPTLAQAFVISIDKESPLGADGLDLVQNDEPCRSVVF